MNRAARLAVCLSLALASAQPLMAVCSSPTFLQQPVVPADGISDFALAELGPPDGDLDLFTVSPSQYPLGVSVYPFDDATGTFGQPDPKEGAYPTDIAVADFNGDGKNDYVVGQTKARPQCEAAGSCASIKIGLYNVNGGFSGTTYSLTYANDVKRILPADFNKDGKMDVLVAHSNFGVATPGLTLLWGSGPGTFTTADYFTVNGPVGDAAVGDFDNDGDLDFVVAIGKGDSTTASHLDLFRNDDGLFGPSAFSTRNLPSTSADLRIATGQFSATDTNLDLAVSMKTTTVFSGSYTGPASAMSYLPGTGTGTFTGPNNNALSGKAFIDVALADVNEDNVLDGVVLEESGGYVIFPGAPIGGSMMAIERWGLNAQRILSVDHDRDGRTDLFFMGSSGVVGLLNRCAGYSKVDLSSSPNPSSLNSPATFTATIITKPGAPVPTGTVTFFEGTTELGSAPVNDAGNASLAVSNLSLGSHTIKAVYNGDSHYSSTTSPNWWHGVQRPPFGAPVNVTATGNWSNNVITIRWIATQNSVDHEVLRRENGQWVPIGTTAEEVFTDPNRVNTSAYIYAVRSRGGESGTEVSPMSAPDIATTAVLALPFDGTIRASDFQTTRQLIASLRAAVGATPYTFTDASLAGQQIKVLHLTELRAALTPPRNAIGLPAVAFTHPTPTAKVTTVKLVDLQEIRNSFQ